MHLRFPTRIATAKKFISDVLLCVKIAVRTAKSQWRSRNIEVAMPPPLLTQQERFEAAFKVLRGPSPFAPVCWELQSTHLPPILKPQYGVRGYPRDLTPAEREAIYKKVKESGLPPGLQFGDDIEFGNIEGELDNP